ncbi:MAG: helicase-associated domain-containing protein [Chloroflexi bacterium]|nr:helicase-associated domain-containing protein [Chloroflexota bacterium]
MRTLLATLRDMDPALLPILAARWGVDVRLMDSSAMIAALNQAMLESERAARIWDGLDNDQRGRLQLLLSSGGKMPSVKFALLSGEIRKMGAARVERERPHERPASIAEALYYRGLIAHTFEQGEAGLRPVIYVPDDLAQVLPLHKTSYSNLEDDEDDTVIQGLESGKPVVSPLNNVPNARQADTTIVDDMTTLLAYLQVRGAGIEDETLARADRDALAVHLLTRGEARMAFLLGVGLSAELIEIQGGRAFPKRAEARRWLAEKRAEQLKILAYAWRGSTLYRDLWHVDGLYPESSEAGGMASYDPADARQAVINLLADLAPRQAWWPLEEFISAVKDENADFQRSDYDSWYVRNDDNEYLRGFESWEAVEGALLEFYITGPMHWLGLTDLGDDAARLTAYGRAFVLGAQWPTPAEQEEKVIVQPDGTLLISRKVTRIDRFQAARFTTWGAISGDKYVYKLDNAGLQQAVKQGIEISHISSFLTRALDNAPLPPNIARFLEKGGARPPATQSVSVARALVLRCTAPETLDFILDTPALRRYMGARLGPMAAIVRAGEWEALKDALAERGIAAEMLGE